MVSLHKEYEKLKLSFSSLIDFSFYDYHLSQVNNIFIRSTAENTKSEYCTNKIESDVSYILHKS